MPIISPIHRTPSLKKEEIKKSWYLVDATDKTLGRLSSAIAARLRGKHKSTFTPNQDCGDNIVVINAAKVRVTGKKRDQKIYYKHSLYPGGLTATTFKDLIKKQPEKVVLSAVKGMLPKSRLGDVMLGNVRVFPGEEHTLNAQKPIKLDI
ncbi:MAG: 50S ribosomal protein L13 [Leptospiraceae bacterium]|nr:50S ribosomal protein L13 [Leptospiraceae bacterium]MCP5496178.1 50S ribosomal protein L13 [Leptospiraceae bacterium]